MPRVSGTRCQSRFWPSRLAVATNSPIHGPGRLSKAPYPDRFEPAMYAVIASGGKQEKVAQGQQVQLELLHVEDGQEVLLTPVLLVDGSTVLSTPEQLKGASVKGRVIGTAKGPKIDGFTYKRRTNNRRRYGHRQKYSVVEITSIAKG